MVLNIELGAEVFKLLVIKLSTIIGNNNSRKTKSKDDGFPNKIFGFALGDLGHRFSFYPFGEAVDSHKQKFLLC